MNSLELALNVYYGIKYLKKNIKKFETPWLAIISKKSVLVDTKATMKYFYF